MISPLESISTAADRWIVIWAESRAEKQVAKRVAAMGLPAWVPVFKERRRWSDRWREVEFPLFPGYLFARVTSADWSRVLQTPGVLTVVRHNGKPALLSDSFIATLRDAVGRDGVKPEAVTETPEYAPGDEVIVQEGALRGVRGIVRERRGARQLVLWVAEIGRGVAFTIGSALVKPSPTP